MSFLFKCYLLEMLYFIIFQNVTGMSPVSQEDFSELPPNQRRKKLQAKIDELTGKISQVWRDHEHYYEFPSIHYVLCSGDRRSWRTDEDEDSVRGQPCAGGPHVNTGDDGGDLGNHVFKQNSSQGQLTENGHRLDKLRSDFRRYQGWLEEADGSPASTLSIRTGNGLGSEASPRRSSVSDEVESLSRSASDSSVNHNKNGSLVTSIISQGWGKVIIIRM